jgi:hypothetical protein
VTAAAQSPFIAVAPESIPAAHHINGTVDRTRPAVPIPEVARWRGTGSTDEAANFSCVVDAAPRSTQ